MEAKRSWVRRLTQWSLAGACVVMLWIGGYYGGRKAGVDAGREEGIALGRKDGFEEGMELLGLRETGHYQIDLSAIIDRRLGPAPGANNSSPRQAEMIKIISEIMKEVRPERWKSETQFAVRGFPTNMTLIVDADAEMLAEVQAYLHSKDEYLAWRATKDESDVESSQPRTAAR